MAVLGVGTAGFLPRYGLGTVTALAGSDLLEEAIRHGVRYIDTAAAYGSAEDALGELAGLLRRENVRVCTKLAAPAAQGLPRLVAQLRGSLTRLRLDGVDTVMLHSADPAVLELPRVQQQLAAIKQEALADRAGLSTYGTTAAMIALASPFVDSVQVEHSILNPSVVRRVRQLKRPAQEIVARSVLCQGLLTARWRAASIVTPALGRTLEELEGIAASWELELPGLALRYALDTPGVDVVVVGFSTRGELCAALAAASRPPLTGDQLELLSSFDHSADDTTHPERWVASIS